MKAAQKEHVDAVAYWRERATRAEEKLEPFREAVANLLHICGEANRGAFDNGVIGPDGRDEGDYLAGCVIDRARAALEGK